METRGNPSTYRSDYYQARSTANDSRPFFYPEDQQSHERQGKREQQYRVASGRREQLQQHGGFMSPPRAASRPDPFKAGYASPSRAAVRTEPPRTDMLQSTRKETDLQALLERTLRASEQLKIQCSRMGQERLSAVDGRLKAEAQVKDLTQRVRVLESDQRKCESALTDQRKISQRLLQERNDLDLELARVTESEPKFIAKDGRPRDTSPLARAGRAITGVASALALAASATFNTTPARDAAPIHTELTGLAARVALLETESKPGTPRAGGPPVDGNDDDDAQSTVSWKPATAFVFKTFLIQHGLLERVRTLIKYWYKHTHGEADITEADLEHAVMAIGYPAAAFSPENFKAVTQSTDRASLDVDDFMGCVRPGTTPEDLRELTSGTKCDRESNPGQFFVLAVNQFLHIKTSVWEDLQKALASHAGGGAGI